MEKKRRSGILLHITSLPGGVTNGELGQDAYRFVDFLAESGATIWQLLPTGPTHGDGSPYQSLSVHAGNADFVSLDSFFAKEWLDANDRNLLFDARIPVSQRKLSLIDKVHKQFQRHASQDEKNQFQYFTESREWLDDYALFTVLRQRFDSRSWTSWPAEYASRQKQTLSHEMQREQEAINAVKFGQFLFHTQWLALKRYANSKGILLFGDMPIFVAHDSSDVWAHRQFFKLDAHGNPTVVAGVPPDYFSATGQRWGNPLYDWDSLGKTGYQWWIERLHSQFEYFDIVRIDHFRGFEAYWEILAEHDTAINGHWVLGPGAKFFHALQKVFGDKLPLVAEDLGYITPQVHALRQQFRLPGMKILHFAFDSGADNPYLPHHHEVDSVVYTGTHDNNTTLGWFNGLTDTAKKRVFDYFGNPSDTMPTLLIRSAFASVASTAIVPMQDVMGLDGMHRMNTPGTTVGNWQWRFRWEQLRHDAAAKLRELNTLYDRLIT